ncbi:nitroreductase family protein [Rheinheimera sp.]|uniref:nitroreductase family protein n=1 Tax=Rheinheimera sp. TaxID=1869214 RepID=UPI00307F5D41
MKKHLQQLRQKLDRTLLPLAAKSRLAANLYYAFFNPHFRREQHATAAGRQHYHQHEESSTIASVILRRNIHRLEKGLSMVPRKPLFALDYIDETLTALQNLLHDHQALDLVLLKYCHDVLDSYFSVTQWPAHATQPGLFAALQAQIAPRLQQGRLAAPAPYAQRPRAPISYDDFYTLCQQRCSVRTFLSQPVPRAELEKAVSAAAQAPSACNRQPFRYIAATEGEMLTKLANLPMGTVGYANGIPALLAVVGDLSAYPFERDRHVIYIDASLANMQLMLALETQGLASCSINWPDIENYEKKIARLLKLQPFERVVMLIAVGYPDPAALIPHSEKKTATELLSYV